LTFAAEEIPAGATEYKCAPPIRERENRERLWGALRERLLDQVVTDHSPSTAALKCSDSGDFTKAWGGIASLQIGLAAVWTSARVRGLGVADVVEWMCAAPARLVSLGKKGRIAKGCDADLVVWSPDDLATVDKERLEHKNKVTPYHGRALQGRVLETWLRGEKIFDRGVFVGGARRGEWIRRGNA
jgi:allantoinase